jgi:SsrA-binding protein
MSTKTIATNRRARFDYHILDTYEAGLVLLGSEVKSLREGRASLRDGYAIVKDGEMFLIGCRISPYPFARGGGHEPDRTRKLLLNRREIDRIRIQVEERGRTVVPVRLYFKDGKAKVEIAVAKGKDRYDKRETLKRRQADREMERAMRYRSLD